MDEHYCLYALTRADCPTNGFGPGVDPRFPVELVRYGRLAAVTSRVGLDQFDLAKLQEGTADLPWLSKVAVRHNEIVVAVARNLPVLPMRMGIFFASRSSLIAKLVPYEANTVEFLRRIEDQQEWAVKIYVDEDRAEKAILANATPARPPAPSAAYLPARPYGRIDPLLEKMNVADVTKDLGHTGRGTERNPRPLDGPAHSGGGTQYLAAKGMHVQRRQQVHAMVRQAVLTVEARLQGFADSLQRLRLLPTTLTNRPEKMVWNGAFLLSRSAIRSFHAACEQLRIELTPTGVNFELTGPWPPYHFCPSFESQDENSPCHCTC